MKRAAWVFLITLGLSGLSHADTVYRWTDESGKVHFGAQPPNLAVGDEIKLPEKSPYDVPDLPEDTDRIRKLLTGHWSGTRLGKSVEWVLDQDGRFVEAVMEDRPGYSRISYISYAGYWQFEHRRLSIQVVVRDRGSERLPAVESATLLKQNASEMVLNFDDNGERFVKRVNSSRPAFPQELSTSGVDRR